MEFKETIRKHLLEIFLVFIALQLGIFALVQNHNNRPQAVGDTLAVIQGREARISPLANDLDKDEKDVLNLAKVSSPRHGTIKRRGNVLVYLPTGNFTGEDSIAYTITDGKKESKPACIVFRIIRNQAPLVRNDKAEVYSGETAVIYALDNDEDKEKDSLFLNETTHPLHGTLTIKGNKILYKAGNSAETADSFYYTVSDGRNISDKALVRITVQKKTSACYPWLSSDIGDVSKPGVIACNSNSMAIQVSGSDIWNNADGFYFIYQLISGNGEINAKVESLEGPHDWTKSGLMIRESLGAASRNAFIGLTTKNGITSQIRPENNEFSENIEGLANIKAPYWIKLSREGDTCRFFTSPDGKSWKKLSSTFLPLPATVYMGMAVTSHDNSRICKTTISQCKLAGKPGVFKP